MDGEARGLNRESETAMTNSASKIPKATPCGQSLWGPHKTNVGCCKSNNRHLVIGQTDRYSAAGASAAGAASSALGAAFLPARRVDFLAAFLVSLSMFSL